MHLCYPPMASSAAKMDFELLQRRRTQRSCVTDSKDTHSWQRADEGKFTWEEQILPGQSPRHVRTQRRNGGSTNVNTWAPGSSLPGRYKT